ncbi:hypothetical protein BLNAU_6675 [Blattamonas nauphoetae]|uniref:Uncharacterized protein n=1 Tax=Blattamonas nauphoetae TaxID=2049346 RepID=A0ABQ9Y3S1_9EUKA|nr:hypothetical protein BLNAU_6675 [Blattamonas nauphoetae]
MTLLVLILIYQLCVEATFIEERIMPLSLQMVFSHSTEAHNISGNERTFVPKALLNHGMYHSNAYRLDSVSLSLHGSDTTICHTSSLANTESVNDLDSENYEYTSENTAPFIFVFSNSTISMFHISLDCGWRGTCVGRISSSRLTIENCPIISNPESSPFVINNGWDDCGSSVFFVDCCHKSIEKSSLLPLVSLTPSHITHASHTDNGQNVASTLVSCSSLSLTDAHLSIGSGPLVGFSSKTEQDAELSNKLETVLIGSRLVNMTSGEGKGAMKGWSGSQTILGSSVTRSTNHLYGTTCIDMNLGGSLLCSNTSFSHCHSSLKPSSTYPHFSLQHKYGSGQHRFGSEHTEDVTFSRCTFISAFTSGSGGAIRHYRSVMDRLVKCPIGQLSGHGTTGGGSIHAYSYNGDNAPVTLSSTIFTENTGQQGAAASLFYRTTCTITNVVFRNSTASDTKGGGLVVSSVASCSLSNTVFDTCIAQAKKATSTGGGVYMFIVASIELDSVLFRECSAQQGNDLYFMGGRHTIQKLVSYTTNCDSTSEMPNVFDANDKVLDETLIPAVPTASTATLEEIGSTPMTDQTSTIQMRVSQQVDGKMLVVVDNTNNHEPPNTNCSPPHVNSPPAIPRLLTFDFSSSTESATPTVSFGEWEELQYESEYHVIGASIANTRLSFSSSVALTTPNPARIVQITCSLGSGTDHCWLQLKGRTLPKGTYTVKLVGIDDFSFTVEFDGSKGEKTLNMFSSPHSEKLFGAESKLSFSTTYEVESITFEDNSVLILLDPPLLVFTTPAEQPQLTSVGPASFKDDTTKDTILIPLAGSDLSGSSFTLKLVSSSSSESVSLPITFSTSNSESFEFIVYSKDANNIQLSYGTTYSVKEMITGTTQYLFETAFSIEVPDEPKRIEDGWVTLSGTKEATVRLKGRALTDGSYSLKLNSVDSVRTSEPTLSNDGELLFKVPISTSPSSILTFGATYTISSLKFGSDDVIVNSDVELAVPNPSIVETATVHPNSINTSMTLDLAGTGLELDGFYTVTLSPSFSFDMLFNGSPTVSSPKLLLGRADGLLHSTKYTIVSITRVEDGSDEILTDGIVSFTTPKSPVPLILHVNRKEGEDDVFCGESDTPCSTIDFAWSIVSALKAKTSTLAIVNSSKQTQPILISSGMSVLLSNGGNLEPTLTVPSSASMGDKAGLVVVDDAGFEVDDVTIKIESTDPSFVFLAASESTVILKEGSFIGQPLPTLSLNSESEDVCSWDSGIIRLDNCTTKLDRMTLSSLSQGAIHLKSGSVNVDGVIFRDNSPHLVSFPSARRNIRCVEGGDVTIGSLNGGDGSTDKHPHLWLSHEGCSLSGEDARPDSPLFVPTLSSESTSSWVKKEKHFSLTIVGTTMIPCGLSLEVFEMKKDKSEGKSARVELSSDTADSFNETHITLSIPLTSLSSLESALEWRGRLVFGLNQTTSEWFVVQKNSADRMAQSPLEHMKWWLPLVIVLSCCALFAIIVIVVVLRRRQKQKAQKDSEIQQASSNEMEEDKIEVEQIDNQNEAKVVHTSVNGLKAGSVDPEKGDESTPIQTKLMNAPLAACVSVLDCSRLETKEMLSMETLFERLHRNRKGLLDKRAKQIELARGLQKLGKLNPLAEVLLHLSSHWILVDVDGRLNIQMNRGSIASHGGQSKVNHSTANDSVLPQDSRSVNMNNENVNGMNREAKVVREKEDQEDQRCKRLNREGTMRFKQAI